MAWSSIALAQPGMAEVTPPSTTSASTTPSTTPAASVEKDADTKGGIATDVDANRAWLTPTALTQPKGSWTMSNYELLGFGLTYGVTDKIELSANGLLVEDKTSWFTGKAELLESGPFHLAAHGATFHGGNESVFLLGLAGTLCIDRKCDSNVSGYVGRFFSRQMQEDKVVMTGLSLTLKLSTGIKFVAEVNEFRERQQFDSNDFSLAWYGVRFTNHKLAFELGLLKRLGEETGEFPMGFPWVSFTVRTGG